MSLEPSLVTAVTMAYSSPKAFELSPSIHNCIWLPPWSGNKTPLCSWLPTTSFLRIWTQEMECPGDPYQRKHDIQFGRGRAGLNSNMFCTKFSADSMELGWPFKFGEGGWVIGRAGTVCIWDIPKEGLWHWAKWFSSTGGNSQSRTRQSSQPSILLAAEELGASVKKEHCGQHAVALTAHRNLETQKSQRRGRVSPNSQCTQHSNTCTIARTTNYEFWGELAEGRNLMRLTITYGTLGKFLQSLFFGYLFWSVK